MTEIDGVERMWLQKVGDSIPPVSVSFGLSFLGVFVLVFSRLRGRRDSNSVVVLLFVMCPECGHS